MAVEIDIALPVYNEEKRLEKGVLELHRYCVGEGLSFTISIADNGSVDKTVEMARRLAAELPNLRVVTVGVKGVGAALTKTWESSAAKYIGYMDIDLSTSLDALKTALSDLRQGKSDVVNASRLLPGSIVVGRTLKRELSSRVFNFLLKALLGVHFTDGMCGFKFLRKEAYEKMVYAGISNREWFFNTECLVVAEWINLRITEIPVRWQDDARSKVRIFELAVKYLKEIFRLRSQRSKYRQFVEPTSARRSARTAR